MSFAVDDVSAIVMDAGSCFFKAGHAGDDTPKCISSSIVRENHASSSAAAAAATPAATSAAAASKRRFVCDGDVLARAAAAEHAAHAVRHGLVEDWSAMEAIWAYTLRDRLRLDPSEHPILHAEAPFAPREQRERMISTLFESFDVPALFLAKDTVLSAFACGKTRALVVDIGHGTTCVTPIFDGYALAQGTVYSSLGGERLDAELLRRVGERASTPQPLWPRYAVHKREVKPGVFEASSARADGITDSFHNAALAALARDMRESVCRTAESASAVGTSNGNADEANLPAATYELPDGNTLDLAAERYAIPELLFDPSPLNDNKIEGLNAMINRAVLAADVDIRRDLFGAVLVAGGCALTPNLVERVEKELAAQVPNQVFKVRMVAQGHASERSVASWIGGSILASLGTFQQIWISRAEYNEVGASIVNTKCP